MVNNFNPTYFEATPLKQGSIRLTDEVTKKPVSETDPFYQEKQSGGKCSVHSMDAFAGSKAVDITDLMRVNNETQKELFGKAGLLGLGQSDVQVLKTNGVYLETLKDLDDNGVNPGTIKSYLEKHKNEFNLSKDCSIDLTEGAFEAPEMDQVIDKIQKNSSLHRVILGIAGRHYLTIRKDNKGRWRIIDSQTLTHDSTTTDKTKKIQPRFSTLKQAIRHVTIKYASPACIIISPTKEKTDWPWKYIAIGALAVVGAVLWARSSRSVASY